LQVGTRLRATAVLQNCCRRFNSCRFVEGSLERQAIIAKEASTLNGTTIERQTITRNEAAEYLGIHLNTLDKTPEIPRIRIGGKVLFRIKTLEKYRADQESKKEQTLTRNEAAEYLGIALVTLDLSSIPRIRVNGRVLFKIAALDKYLSDREYKGKIAIRRNK